MREREREGGRTEGPEVGVILNLRCKLKPKQLVATQARMRSCTRIYFDI